MPKIKKPLLKKDDAQRGTEILRRRGVSPIAKLVELAEERLQMTDPERAKALLNGWLKDWELCQDGVTLRLRAGIRWNIWQALAEYEAPRLKASGEEPASTHVTVVIEQPAPYEERRELRALPRVIVE